MLDPEAMGARRREDFEMFLKYVLHHRRPLSKAVDVSKAEEAEPPL